MRLVNLVVMRLVNSVVMRLVNSPSIQWIHPEESCLGQCESARSVLKSNTVATLT